MNIVRHRLPKFLGKIVAYAIVVSVVILATDLAVAKNTNNNGNSGNHANNGNHGQNQNKSDKSEKNNTNGNSSSALGALNAAHASANALLHANPNSRVGRIAVFRDAVLETGVIAADRDAAADALALLTPPTRTSDEVQADLDLATIALGDADALIADLADNDPFDQVAYDEAVADRGLIADEIDDLNGELASNAAYDTAADLLADLEETMAVRPLVERGLLEAAANKPVTDAVELAVEELLGLN